MSEQAEQLWESLGGDLCICQRAEVVHWCEKCQQRIGLIAQALRERSAREWQDIEMSIALGPDADKRWIDIQSRAEQAEQQLADSVIRQKILFDDAVQSEGRVEVAEQQLAAARAQVEEFTKERTDMFAVVAKMTRAQVIAQVKALTREYRDYHSFTAQLDKLSGLDIDGFVTAAGAAKLDALQPDPSLAVLSVQEREQALKFAAASTPHKDDIDWSRSQSALADARRLLKLPAQPTPEDAQ